MEAAKEHGVGTRAEKCKQTIPFRRVKLAPPADRLSNGHRKTEVRPQCEGRKGGTFWGGVEASQMDGAQGALAKLPGLDSNQEYGNQNPVCYPLHHRAVLRGPKSTWPSH